MQKRSLETINLVDDDEDDDFLSQVAEVEAQALAQAVSSKRVKPSLPTRIVADAYAYEKPEIKPQAEGVYLAALRGDDASPSWLHQQSGVAQLGFGGRSGAGGGGGSGDNACFKCGKLGHWARDCDGGPIGGGGAMQSGELQKACPCGLGECLVLTANTERNRGRRFYKCPVREENGGCGFFEWCDSASGTSNLSSAATQSGFTSSFPDLSCPCGAGSCLILTAKTGNNVGQQFYRCPANQRNSCGFFKWCNDRIDVVPGSPLIANKSYRSFNNSNSTGSGVGGESSCFKCGKKGHWAKDCSSSSSDQFFGSSGKSSSTGSCFKCGKSGHWARDCLSSQNLNMSK